MSTANCSSRCLQLASSSQRLTLNGDQDLIPQLNACMSGANRVYELLVDGPDLVPFLVSHVFTGTLTDDELTESLNLQTSSEDTLQDKKNTAEEP